MYLCVKMPAINSAFNEEAESVETTISKIPFLNIKTKHRGPMGNADPSSVDIIDEAISLYRANVLMSSMEIKGTADHLLIYLTLTISGASRSKSYCVPDERAEVVDVTVLTILCQYSCRGDQATCRSRHRSAHVSIQGDSSDDKNEIGSCHARIC